jgi:hypothetical protein
MTWDFKNGTVHVYGDSTGTYGEIKQFTGLPSFLEVDKTYSIGRVENNMHLGFWLFDTNNNLLVTLSTETNNPATIPDNVAKATMYYAGLTNGTAYNFEQHYMLNEGATVKPFEPYVGNEPSPSMNYPQKVEFLGESGSIKQWLLAKNIFAGDVAGGYLSNIDGSISSETENIVNVACIKNYIPLLENILTVLVQGYSSDMPIAYAYRIAFYDKDKKWISNTVITQEITKIQAPDDAKYVRFSAGALDTMAVYFGDISNALYEAPTSQPFTFQTSNGLCGIPLGQTIPSVIANSPIHLSGVYHDGEQYWIGDTKNENGKDVQRVFKTTIDGNSNIWDYGNPKTLSNIFGLGVSGIVQNSLVLCNNMTCHEVWGGDFEGIWVGADDSVSFRLTNDLTGITTEDSSEQKVAKVKELLTNNPIEIYYWKKDEPIITDTTEEEKTQLDALVMNYPNTTIVNDEGAYMEVEYVADTQMYILK